MEALQSCRRHQSDLRENWKCVPGTCWEEVMIRVARGLLVNSTKMSFENAEDAGSLLKVSESCFVKGRSTLPDGMAEEGCEDKLNLSATCGGSIGR